MCNRRVCVLGSVSNISNSSTLTMSWIIFLGRRTELVVGFVLLYTSLKRLSVRVVLDLLDQFTNTTVLSLFHNRMWQSGYSEVDVNLVYHWWLVICITANNGSPRSVVFCFVFHIEVCAVTRETFGAFSGKQRVSPWLSWFISSSREERVSISLELDALCSWLVSRQTTCFTVPSWSGFGFGWLYWELLDCLTTSEPKSFIHLSWRKSLEEDEVTQKPFS